MGYVLYLIALAFVALWVTLRPGTGIRRLLTWWGLGIVLMRVIPEAWGIALPSRALGFLPHLSGWIGAIVLLRALWGLLSWGRPDTRRTRLWRALFVAGMILGGLPPVGGLILLGIPWFLSVRWRRDLGGVGLLLASLIGLLSLLLCGVSFGSIVAFRQEALSPGLSRLWGIGIGFGIVYGAVMMVASAARVHLSIRRIGRRLFVSHLMAGLVPVVLVAIFLLLSSALFLSTYRGLISQRYLGSISREARWELARGVDSPPEETPRPFGARAEGQIILARVDQGETRVVRGEPRFPADSLLAFDAPSRDFPLLWDGTNLYLRARIDTTIAGTTIRREALAPVDSLGMVVVSRLVGIPVRVNPGVHVARERGGVQIGPESPDSAGGPEVAIDGRTVRLKAIGPRQPEGLQLPGGGVAQCVEWTPRGGFRRSAIPISSSAGVGEEILALISIAEENPLAIVVLIVLSVIATLFIAAVWITISMVATMTRSITRSVSVLSTATAALGEGRLDHRITIEGEDELWRVAGSFNEMAEGLERMREMELTNERLEEELRVARRIQERLLPEAPPAFDRLELAGISLPARHVGGDYFDYIPIDGGRRVAVAVADVSGKGVGAALLMSSFRASLRSQDLDRIGPAQASAILNRFVCGSVDPGKFITAFLALCDPSTGEIRYVNAGHEPPILMRPDGTIEELARGGLIMGAFAHAEYEEGRVEMPPGSILAVFTDGVTEARNAEGGFLGDAPLREILRRSSEASCAEILQRVVSKITAFAADEPQSDDITLLLARRR